MFTKPDRSDCFSQPPADKVTLKLPPKYQFGNVVCYIYLLILLANIGINRNSIDAGQTSPSSILFYPRDFKMWGGASKTSVTNLSTSI